MDKIGWYQILAKVVGVPFPRIVLSLFANGPGDLGSTPGRVISKTLKMVFDTSLLNTQHYNVRI